MGKSPGKWIKTLLFGKKSSKSYISKGVTSAAKVAVSDVAVNTPVISDPLNQSIDRGGEKTELENDTTNRLRCDSAIFPSGTHDVDSQLVLGTVSTDAELELQAQAATKAQAAVRGYLARHAFQALKGIIRLQALIRGHLVRRQAVSTLHCTRAIVRIQALARGRRVRVSDCGKNSFGEHKDVKPADSSAMCISLRSEKLATNAFVCKLLAVMPRAMPLSLEYDVVEPNCAWNWVERWSISHFWTPLSRPNKSRVDTQVGRLKTSARKVATISISNGDNDVSPGSLQLEKLKRIPRKEPLQEQPQNEFERVKRNLRKVSEAEIEMEQPTPVKIPKSSAPDQVAVDYSNKLVDSAIEGDKSAGTAAEHPAHTLELSSKEDEANKENQRTRRRKSLPAKQEYTEKTQSLPGYMAATASAKAKLKPQGAPEDGAENNFIIIRRHSLPSSTNAKFNQTHQKVQANGEGGNKINKSISSSRDEKVPQPGWRR